MDPNKTLQEMRRLVGKVQRDYQDEDGNGVDQDDAASLVSYVESMDEWLSQGGFLPVEWRYGR